MVDYLLNDLEISDENYYKILNFYIEKNNCKGLEKYEYNYEGHKLKNHFEENKKYKIVDFNYDHL